MRTRYLSGWLLLLLLLIGAGCGGGGGKGSNTPPVIVNNDTSYLYVGTNSGSQIKVYSPQNDGTLVEVATHAPGGSVYAVKASPNGRFLTVVYYDSSQSAYTLTNFEIDQATGNLVDQKAIVKLGAGQPFSMDITPNNKFLYILEIDSDPSTDHLIRSVKLKEDGSVEGVPTTMIINSDIRKLAVSADGTKLFVTKMNTGSGLLYSINSTDGTLTLLKSITIDRSTDSLAVLNNTLYFGARSGVAGSRVSTDDVTAMQPFVVEGDGIFHNVAGVDSSGSYLVTNSSTYPDLEQLLNVFKINTSNGQLTKAMSLNVETIQGGYTRTILDPVKPLIYSIIANDGTTNNLFVYGLNTSTGQVTYNTKAYSVGDTPWTITGARIKK